MCSLDVFFDDGAASHYIRVESDSRVLLDRIGTTCQVSDIRWPNNEQDQPGLDEGIQLHLAATTVEGKTAFRGR